MWPTKKKTPQLSARSLNSTSISSADLIRQTSRPWQPGRTGFIHQPLDCSIQKQKSKKQHTDLFFSSLSCYLHTDWPLMWASCRKGCCRHAFLQPDPPGRGSPLWFIAFWWCGEDRFPVCTVEALLSCRAVTLHPADLFNQEHRSRTQGQEVRIHHLSGPLLSFPLLSSCWSATVDPTLPLWVTQLERLSLHVFSLLIYSPLSVLSMNRCIYVLVI